MDRRRFLTHAGRATLVLGAPGLLPSLVRGEPTAPAMQRLDGTWRFRLDPESMGREYETWFRTRLPAEIRLPGSTDEQGFGIRATGYELGHLTRQWRYEGEAWYQRDVEIPAEWRGKRITLFLERPHWSTSVWVGDTPAGTRNSLSVPHRYDLSESLGPGRHELTIKVDNRYLLDVGRNAHSVTDHTQTNWNGIVGRVELQATDPVWIESLKLTPDVERGRVRVEGVAHNATGAERDAEVRVAVRRSGAAGRVARLSQRLGPLGATRSFSVTVPLPAPVAHWDEFQPALYEAEATLSSAGGRYVDRRVEIFGMRQIAADGKRLLLNGRPVFLRGTLECCIFPQTGYPPTDVASWSRLYEIARSYGLNHFRFHSYCPPEAAFVAADRAGFLLEVELPVWNDNIGRVPDRDAFMRAEGERIQDAYGNHPSFAMLAMGNELQGDWSFINALTEHLEQRDPRRLYTTHADHVRYRPEPASEFFIAQRTSRTTPFRLHGSPRLAQPHVGTDFDFADYIREFRVPTIAHEIGQWVVNPAYDDLDRYTGNLKPANLVTMRDQLAERGMLDQAREMALASGRFAWLLYKEDLESCFRTPDFAGFQMLQLQDFPGQGEALIGLLNSLWESKGIMTPEEFRGFCRETVPLVRMEKFVWTADETLRATAQVNHHGAAPLRRADAVWRLVDGRGNALAGGRFAARDIGFGVTTLGAIMVPLAGVTTPAQLRLILEIPSAGATNRWDAWVYPRELDTTAAELLVARRYDDETRAALAAGRRVLVLSDPERTSALAIRSQFLPVFWSLSWFEGQPGTSSILCDPAHAALAAFPTQSHTNWQWRELLEPSKAFVLDDTPSTYRPLVQVIDDYHRNHKLGAVFETRVGPGRLLVSGLDLRDVGRGRPVARQLLHSLLAYMRSDRFAPAAELDPALLARLLS